MTSGPAQTSSGLPIAVVVDLLRAATGEDPGWAGAVRPETRIDGDLMLDSIEIAALADTLHERTEGRTDLLAHLQTLEIDAIIELTVADVAALSGPIPGHPA